MNCGVKGFGAGEVFCTLETAGCRFAVLLPADVCLSEPVPLSPLPARRSKSSRRRLSFLPLHRALLVLCRTFPTNQQPLNGGRNTHDSCAGQYDSVSGGAQQGPRSWSSPRQGWQSWRMRYSCRVPNTASEPGQLDIGIGVVTWRT